MAFALNLGSLNVVIGANTSKFDASVKRMQNTMVQAGRKMEAVGGRIQSVGRKMSLFLTAPIIAFGGASVKAFADFDDAITRSTAIMSDVTPKIRKEMEDLALSISREGVTSAKDLGEAYFFLASAGLNAQQSMGALAQVNKFAIAGQFDMARATDLLTDAQSALGLVSKDTTQNLKNLTEVSDVLVKANTLANASVEQFSKSLVTKAAASLRNLNKDVQEGVAVLAAFADQGIKGELAGEKLSIVLRDLQNASIKNRKAFQVMNLSIFDTQGKMLPIVDIIRQLENRLGKMSDQQKKTTLSLLGFQDRSVSALQSLIGTSDAIARYEKELRKAGGTTASVAGKQVQSFTSSMKNMLNNVVAVGIELGRVLAPVVQKVAGFIKELADRFFNLTSQQKLMSVIIGTVVAAAGPLLIIFGGIISTAGTMLAALVSIGPILIPIIAGVAALGAAMVALISKVIGPDSIKFAFLDATQAVISFLQKTIGITDSTVDTILGMADSIVAAFDRIRTIGDVVWNGIVEGALFLIGIIDDVISFFSDITKEQVIVGVLFGAIIASAVPLGVFLASVVSILGTIITTFIAIIPVIIPVVLAVAALAAAVVTLASKIVGPKSLEAGFDSATTSMLSFFKQTLGFSDKTLKVFNRVFAGIKFGFAAIALFGTLVWDGMLSAVKVVAAGILFVFGKAVERILIEFGKLEVAAGAVVIKIGEQFAKIPGFGDTALKLLEAGRSLQETGAGRAAGAGENAVLKASEAIFKSAEGNAVAIQEAGNTFDRALGALLAADSDFSRRNKLGEFDAPKVFEKPEAAGDSLAGQLKDSLASAIGGVKGLFGGAKNLIGGAGSIFENIKFPDIKTPEINFGAKDGGGIPEFKTSKGINVASKGNLNQEFKQVSLKRFKLPEKALSLPKEDRTVSDPDALEQLKLIKKAITDNDNVAVMG